MPGLSSRRRPSTSSSAALRFGRLAAMGAVTALILVAGVWDAWGSAQHVMLSKGREHGTMTVRRCSGDTCTGPFRPQSPGSQPRERVVAAASVAVREGGRIAVVVKPGTDEVVRSGVAGLLYAWLPFGGSLMLASVVVAGGLGRTRPAWALGLAGLALVTGAFLTTR
ncbi:hypothetical protein [Streptomyces minutiscleroticus]|uniref:hypothetical protein n=1 Tax=Streptomyces minutiscleroticus TaxID=68238 RepID=UPI0033278628